MKVLRVSDVDRQSAASRLPLSTPSTSPMTGPSRPLLSPTTRVQTRHLRPNFSLNLFVFIRVYFVHSLDFVLICVYFVLLFFLLHICCVIVSTVGWI